MVLFRELPVLGQNSNVCSLVNSVWWYHPLRKVTLNQITGKRAMNSVFQIIRFQVSRRLNEMFICTYI